MNAALAPHCNPLRFWTDRPGCMPNFDAEDASLDREDSLSERNAFLLGSDLGRYRCGPPSNGEGEPHWPHPEMKRGYERGMQMVAERGDAYLLKLIRLKVNAFSRSIPVSSAITVEFLRAITVPVCPVSGVKLTRSARTDTDWSIDRLDNSLGYVPGNVCLMSTRVNVLKRDVGFHELCDEVHSRLLQFGPDSLAAEMPNGLLGLEAIRLAALMAAPAGFSQGKLASYAPFAMAPCAWATLDAVVAGLHIECARSRAEGPSYVQRLTLFKRLGSAAWRLSNRLVTTARSELAMGTHPADIWFNGDTLMLLRNLMDALLADPPEHDQIDSASLAQAMKAGLAPIAEYRR